MDATDTAVPETRYRGRSQALLYNEARPHQGRWCFGKTPMQTFLDADDEGENDRGLTANGHQNLIAQPGTKLSDRVPANTIE